MPESIRPFLWPLVFLVAAALLWVTHAHDAMADFELYHTAASRVLQGESPYQLVDTRPFPYLPALAIAMLPFALFEYEAAKFLWFAVSVGLLTALVRWAVHGLPERRHSEDTLQWIALAVMLPFYAQELVAGQANVLLGVLLVGTLLAVQVDLPRVGGVMLGIAIFIKPFALLLLPWLAFAHGRHAAAATTMVVAAGLLLPALLFGWNGNVQMLVSWFGVISQSPFAPVHLADSVSMGALWAKWFGLTPITQVLTVLSTTAILVGLVAIVWVRRRTVFDPDYLEVALVLLLIPLLSSRGSAGLLLLATPAVVCLLDRWLEVSTRWRMGTGAALATMGAAGLGLFGPDVSARVAGSGVVTLAALTVVVATAHLRWKALG